jgi:hypothetical protein
VRRERYTNCYNCYNCYTNCYTDTNGYNCYTNFYTDTNGYNCYTNFYTDTNGYTNCAIVHSYHRFAYKRHQLHGAKRCNKHDCLGCWLWQWR